MHSTFEGPALRFRSRWLEGLAVRKRGGPGPRTPAAVQAKADRSPRPASNRVMNQGRGRSGFRPCVKNCRIYSEIHELCCFDAKEASS